MNREIASGHYADLALLARFADGVASLIAEAGDGTSESPPAAPAARPKAAASDSSRTAGVGLIQSPPVSPTRKGSKYPYFEISEEWISKVGWSKKNREEYRHFAPVSAAMAVADHVDQTQAPGRLWTVDGLGEVIDREAGEALPSYQLYLVIGWMRFGGLLAKHGRGGYVAVGGGRLKPGVEKALASVR